MFSCSSHSIFRHFTGAIMRSVIKPRFPLIQAFGGMYMHLNVSHTTIRHFKRIFMRMMRKRAMALILKFAIIKAKMRIV